MENKKKPTKAQQRKRLQNRQRMLRWVIQVVFLLCAPGAFSAAFNGAKYIAAQIGGLQAIEPTSFLLLFAALCAFTVVFGRFFCGYACAFGTLGDAIHLLFAPFRSWCGKHFPTWRASKGQQNRCRYVKIVVLALILAICFQGTYDSSWSPWTAFAGLMGGSLNGIPSGAFLLLGAIAVGMGLVDRFFCRFLCPLGALFSFLPVLPVSQFKRTGKHCSTQCACCQNACPVHMRPEKDGSEMGECIACGQCAVACPLENIAVFASAVTGVSPCHSSNDGASGKNVPSKSVSSDAVLSDTAANAAGERAKEGAANAGATSAACAIATAKGVARKDAGDGVAICGSAASEHPKEGTASTRAANARAGKTKGKGESETARNVRRSIKGIHPAWVIVRAAILFALLWAFGAVRLSFL